MRISNKKKNDANNLNNKEVDFHLVADLISVWPVYLQNSLMECIKLLLSFLGGSP